jgi:hypothetical protein
MFFPPPSALDVAKVVSFWFCRQQMEANFKVIYNLQFVVVAV